MSEPDHFAHYRVLGLLGEGAMGAVYRAVDDNLRMTVAIKRLAPALGTDPENLARFEREARAAANLKHPHIAHVFFVGRTAEDLPFYAMEFIDGPSLAAVIRTRMIVSGAQMLTIMHQTASALAFAAEKSVLHRDVKPGNIMISPESGAKLVDFGMAKLADSEASLTASGIALGTPNYISPEQARGEVIDFHADMYSLGVTFYELLCGKTPFTADTPVGVIMKHVREAPPSLHAMNPNYPRGLVRLIERMLAKRAVDRPPTYASVLGELESVGRLEPAFLKTSWSYCDRCGVVRALTEGGRACGTCQALIEPLPVDEILMSVLLTGFKAPEARRKVLTYLCASTGRSPEAVQRLLDSLPFLLAPRLPAEKARALQQKLYRLGAMVDLNKVGTRRIESPATRPFLVLPPSPLTSRMSTGSHLRLQSSEPNARRRTLFLAALLVATAVGAGSHAVLRHYLDQPLVPAEVPAIRHAEPPAEAAPAPAAPRQLVSVYGNCRLTIAGSPPGNWSAQAAELCERLLFEAKEKAGIASLPPISLQLDAGVAPPDGSLFGPEKPSFPYPSSNLVGIKGLAQPEDIFTDQLALLLVQHLVKPYAKPNGCPLILQRGAALSTLIRLRPGRYDPHAVLGSQTLPFGDPEELERALQTGDARAYAQAALFAESIASRQGLGALFEVITAGYEGAAACEQASARVLGNPPHAVVEAWLGTLRR